MADPDLDDDEEPEPDLESDSAGVRVVYAAATLLVLRALARAVRQVATSPDPAAPVLAQAALRSGLDRARRTMDQAGLTVAATAVQTAARHGATTARVELRMAIVDREVVTTINPAVARNIADTLAGRLTAAHRSVVRTVPDIFQRVIAQAAPNLIPDHNARLVVAQRVLNKLTAAGVGFTDVSGRVWGLESYVEMATRTAMMRASRDTHLDQLAGNGLNLVVVSDHGGACPLCAPWEGAVLTIDGSSGDTEGVDVAGSVDTAEAAGLGHPNCRHVYGAFIPDVPPRVVPPYDPQHYEDRQALRGLERHVREWKQREAVALTPTAEAKAAAKVRDWQGAIRSHVESTGLVRQPWRETVGKAR